MLKGIILGRFIWKDGSTEKNEVKENNQEAPLAIQVWWEKDNKSSIKDCGKEATDVKTYLDGNWLDLADWI